jgi:sugar (pentulose or hexulose) kinase
VHAIDALTVTTHGAAAALLDRSGKLALPVLDYEHDGPDALAEAYDAARPDFAETGSPRLPLGLNLGAQLFWQLKTFPDLADRIARVVTYPQYWVWRLTGIAVNEVTSLGCHTDLWVPASGTFSSLVDRLDLRQRMAPVRRPADRIGTISPDLATRIGLDPATPVFCGIHDSNASLYPHLARRRAPFSVVSTGTWVISMAIGSRAVSLDPSRDTLINVNAFGAPVPSARFMGGREFEIVSTGYDATFTERNVAAVLDRAIRLLPSVEPQSGPFQGRSASWTEDAGRLTDGERFAALSFYLALMTATCLEMIGAEGLVVTEGPFIRNRLFLMMLAAASNRPVAGAGDSATGTSIGAALLTRPAAAGPPVADTEMIGPEPRLAEYARKWRAGVNS